MPFAISRKQHKCLTLVNCDKISVDTNCKRTRETKMFARMDSQEANTFDKGDQPARNELIESCSTKLDVRNKQLGLNNLILSLQIVSFFDYSQSSDFRSSDTICTAGTVLVRDHTDFNQ